MVFLNNCIQREPWNVQFHCWYIGAVASSLLLCSGQRITTTTQQKHQHLNSSPRRVVFTTIRRPLPKLQELRKQTALAFRELVHLSTKYPNQQRIHAAITAFLEWDQVMSLLLGPSLNSNGKPTEHYDTYYHHFRTLYQYHKTQWALQENTPLAYKALRCATYNDSGNDVYLKELASALETDPSNMDHWQALVQALGPIGALKSCSCYRCTAMSTTEDCFCHECDRLVPGRTIDHETMAIRNKDTDWWGYERCHWWYECLLQPGKNFHCSSTVPTTNGKRNKNDTTTLSSEILKTKIMNQLKQLETFKHSNDSAASSSSNCETGDDIMRDKSISPPSFEEWFETFLINIDRTVMTDDKSNTKNASTKRKKSRNPYVYVPFLQHDNIGAPPSSAYLIDGVNTHRNPKMTNADFETSRMMGYKVMILCHMYSVAHVGVDVHLQQLYDCVTNATANDASRRKNNISHETGNSTDEDDNHSSMDIHNTWHDDHHPAYTMLCWLYRMGLDVTKSRYNQ